jgi:two-component system sensor histidine kinase/response regulator
MEAPAKEPHAAPEEPVEILVVDDRPDKLLALEVVLSPLREQIVKATSGREALRLLLKRDFALLLMDVQMPDLNGFETAELIRQNERTKNLPIIFISGFEPTRETLKQVYALGAVDFVSTSGAPEVLRSKVAVFVELYRKSRSLQQAVTKMNQKTQQLECFCYTVAHDLRAPLRAMSGLADVLREEYGPVLEEKGRDCTDRIKAASTRLDLLIQDLLGYSRIEHLQLGSEDIDVKSVIETALKHLQHEIETKAAHVSVREPLPKFRSDRGILEHVFLNLISNALKFSRNGVPPRIDIYGEKKGGHVKLWVEDNGIGIAPRHHQRIFGMFERLDAGANNPGTGVGLAIVSKSVERLGGKTGVESELEQGSRFWVELPANPEAIF